MPKLPLWVLSIFLGLVLSPPWGIASWLRWQQRKDHTILPTGSITAKYGRIMGYLLNAICIGIALAFLSAITFWIIISAFICFFLGGWFATLLERSIYCNEQQLEIIVSAAHEYKRLSDSNIAAEVMAEVAPKWWLKLMPIVWQQKLRKNLQPILSTDESEESKISEGHL